MPINSKDKKHINWLYLPFILLSKVYIHYFDDKNNFWIVLPSGVISLIITLNTMVLFLKFYSKPYWFVGLYFLLYFILFFVFNQKFPNYKLVKEIEFSSNQKAIAMTTLLIGIASFFILLYAMRNNA